MYEGQTCSKVGPLTAKKRDRLPARAFGLPEQRKYPMPDPSHAKNAKSRAKAELKRRKITRAQYDKIVRKADRVIARCQGPKLSRAPQKPLSEPEKWAMLLGPVALLFGYMAFMREG